MILRLGKVTVADVLSSFFFSSRRRHTRYWRDWSSDVCSSDLNFSPYALISSETGDSGLMTGYYEPVIEGSRAQDPLHRFPIFGVPQDLVVVDLVAINPDLRNLRLRGRLDGRRLIPYYSRAEIDARGTGLPAPVIAWTADPVELFFLQVQGSGQVQLDSGERIRAGFADQNGHPYRSLGRYLVEGGELPLARAD